MTGPFAALLARRDERSVEYDLDLASAAARRLFPAAERGLSVVVAGTNGKGSTVAALATMLAAAGNRVGSFTSPELLHLGERISIDGRALSEAEFFAAGDRIAAQIVEIERESARQFSFFELTFAVALSVFRAAKLRICIWECGLGGRHDAVNAIDADVAIVTSVGADHLDLLGPALDDVAAHKLGIARPGKMLVAHRASGGADHLERAAARLGLAVQWLGSSETGASPGLPATWNIELALAAAALLGFAVDARNARLPSARQSAVRLGSTTYLVDAAHNAPATEQTTRWLEREWSVQLPIVAITAISAPRNPVSVLEPLRHVVSKFVVVQADHPKSLPADVVASSLRHGGLAAVASPSLRDALALAAEAGATTIGIFGGFYLAGDFLRLIAAIPETGTNGEA